MPADTPIILATSGGYRAGARTRVELAPLVHHAVELSGAGGRPTVVHLGTAGGDQRWWQAELGAAARAAGLDLVHLDLFEMPSVDDVEGLLTGAEAVWVGGGSVANLIAVWRVHGLVADGTLPRAHGTDDGVGLVYGGPDGTQLLEAVTEVRGRSAWVVERGDDGRAVETPLVPRVLPGAR